MQDHSVCFEVTFISNEKAPSATAQNVSCTLHAISDLSICFFMANFVKHLPPHILLVERFSSIETLQRSQEIISKIEMQIGNFFQWPEQPENKRNELYRSLVEGQTNLNKSLANLLCGLCQTR
eukprot:TRINITY_DN8660_c0_g1_i7.p1 TRINITY_DN8660_c0_g1~~TRINITY_DN8660_c0_g1_i7.p1  ORF type:complete len:123 (+),score=25.49 TRINITY_DN8660_c0_g1_i7:369-737(+)